MSTIRSRRKKSVTLETLSATMAQTSSLYSNTSASLRCNFTKAWEALGLILLCGYLRPWNTETIIRQIGQKAFTFNYQGHWKTVQLILESYDFREELDGQQNPKKLIDIFLSHFPPEELFGNIVPTAYKLIKFRAFFRDPLKAKTKKPTPTVFRRGYKDKGSRRLPHERHGIPPYSEKETDRRFLIKHPLVDFVESELSAEFVAEEHCSKTAPTGGEFPCLNSQIQKN